MRMDPDQELSARELVGEWDERRLARTLRDFGEERHAGAIARAIVRRRAQSPIETTLELVETISAAIPAPARFAGGHPAKRSFQALRIAVNDELGQLDRALPLAWESAARGRRARRHLLPFAGGPPRQALLGERARRAASARPTCRSAPADASPKAALLSRRSIVPSAAEVAEQPACLFGAHARRAQAHRRARGNVMTAAAGSRRGTGGPAAPPARPARPAPRVGARPSCRSRLARAAPPATRVLPGAMISAIEALAQHRLLDRLIRGRMWIGIAGVRADRDRHAAARAAEAERRHRQGDRARGRAAARERGAERSKTPNSRPARGSVARERRSA